MITYKTKSEIELIRQSGLVLGKAHGEVAKLIRPGVKTSELDKKAEEYIRDNGGVPSFKGFNNFPASLCISVNEEVVHGIPGNYELRDGDIVSIDCGVFLKGFHSDSAYTYAVGEVKEDVRKLLQITKQSLYVGIEQVKSGARLGDVGYAIQNHVEKYGFSVIRELVGHGIGKTLHEKPEVPNYGKKNKGVVLREGLVLAIEPMINLGRKEVEQSKDGWTIKTSDRKPSAHFEHTVAIIGGRCEILTTFEFIEQVVL